ncbi:hypothetical protein BS47DRAFT_1343430 [Hydnum rufescens UP504]|uniref:Transcription factor IIIC subunit 5 HTH domain-containing protein n=1 Tax=Hydnum rufescens UP504 TaxID=1448309 RepID=A0A9P6AZ99_9AGAM|nr:hypothetical protein BS47DRAFT_1343430 [Hydnum rufescens UP504]
MDIDDGPVVPEVAGEYTTEIVGSTVQNHSISHTQNPLNAGMVDFQYQPDPNDRITKLRASIDQMDEDYTIYEPSTSSPAAGPSTNIAIDANQESEGWNREEKALVARSNLRMFPPPLFSRQGIQQNYNYKQNPVSVPQTVVDEETGVEKQRLVNKHRWKGLAMIFISGDDEVPEQPPEASPAIKAKIDMDLLERIKQKFETRPVWSRIGLFNQFSAKEVKDISNYSNKSLLALACYAFKGGPFHDLLVRFGYDPRLSIESHQYQRLFFRDKDAQKTGGRRRKGLTDDSTAAPSRKPAAANWPLQDDERNTLSGFSSLRLLNALPNRATGGGSGFQVCDVTDPVLKLLLANESHWRDEFHEHDGWYKHEPLERIKALMRLKFIGLKEGRLYTDEESMQFIQQAGSLVEEDGEKKLRPYRNHGHKTNRAKKGMSEPEKQAARLRAALQRDGAGGEEAAG